MVHIHKHNSSRQVNYPLQEDQHTHPKSLPKDVEPNVNPAPVNAWREFTGSHQHTMMVNPYWKSARSAWNCEGFEAVYKGRDPARNLYAKNGVLAKYDAAFGTHMRHSESKDLVLGEDKTCKVISMLDPPLWSVKHQGQTFTPRDIEGLLVCVIDEVYEQESAEIGDENAQNFYEKVIKEWCLRDKDIPIVIEDGSEIPCAFDQMSLCYSQRPFGHMVKTDMEHGRMFYGTTFTNSCKPDVRQSYFFSVKRDTNNVVQEVNWCPSSDGGLKIPRKVWRARPTGDLTVEDTWKRASRNLEPDRVSPENVWKIYHLSR